MNRVFFVGENKIYSIYFPFNVIYDKKETKISYKNLIDIDSQTISGLLSFIKSSSMRSESSLDFIDPVLSLEEIEGITYWGVLRDLLFEEDGYIRYDKDEKAFKEAKIRNEEHKHPLNHLDVFYTNQVTFKLGLKKEMLDLEFIDTLDRDTNCKYIVDA